jgi:hypothetical protein
VLDGKYEAIKRFKGLFNAIWVKEAKERHQNEKITASQKTGNQMREEEGKITAAEERHPSDTDAICSEGPTGCEINQAGKRGGVAERERRNEGQRRETERGHAKSTRRGTETRHKAGGWII